MFAKCHQRIALTLVVVSLAGAASSDLNENKIPATYSRRQRLQHFSGEPELEASHTNQEEEQLDGSLERQSSVETSEHVPLAPPVPAFESKLSEGAAADYESNEQPFEMERGAESRRGLLLSRQLIKHTCQLDRGSQRSEQLNDTYLTHCSRYKLANLLSNEILMSVMHQDTSECERILDEFTQLDETIHQFEDLFTKLLSRYNCHNGYSVKWNCDDCERAYKDWLCANHLPYYMSGERIRPCISFCERVEQRCPYLHPITREQYGGQPVFICRDPNIPFVPKITPDMPYSEPGKCYDLCHLSENLTELIIDSLSKYHHDKCPDRTLIAGQVRSEQELTAVAGTNSVAANRTTHSEAASVPSEMYHEMSEVGDDDDEIGPMNRTKTSDGGKLLAKTTHVHAKKLEELREVLANYKNQAKTHRYHADHSSALETELPVGSNDLNTHTK